MITFWKLWVWRMAYRDSRRGFFRLLLSMSCVVLAVALIVLAFSFRENLLASIQSQSKSLLGADLVWAGGVEAEHPVQLWLVAQLSMVAQELSVAQLY